MPFVSNSGPIAGVRPPKVMTGASLGPHYATPVNTVSASANDLYYIPIYISEVATWSGIKCYNSSAGDTGEVIRFGVYQEGTSGGPSALLADLGTVTLDASSAVRTLASSFTNTYVGWHYLAVHFQSATGLYGCLIQATDTAVGRYHASPANGMPQITLGYNPYTVAPFLFINTAYGALASTAVAPTSSTTTAPLVYIYR